MSNVLVVLLGAHGLGIASTSSTTTGVSGRVATRAALHLCSRGRRRRRSVSPSVALVTTRWRWVEARGCSRPFTRQRFAVVAVASPRACRTAGAWGCDRHRQACAHLRRTAAGAGAAVARTAAADRALVAADKAPAAAADNVNDRGHDPAVASAAAARHLLRSASHPSA